MRRAGLLSKVKSSLLSEGLSFVELGGAVPNPRLSLVYESITLGQKENVDFILAVGGGSVIDSAYNCKSGAQGGQFFLPARFYYLLPPLFISEIRFFFNFIYHSNIFVCRIEAPAISI